MPWETVQHVVPMAGPPLSGHWATHCGRAWSMTFWEGRPSVIGGWLLTEAQHSSAQLCTALQSRERPPVWGHDPVTPRRALSTATPSWQVAAWPGRCARPAEGGPGLPDAVRAYLSPACLQYATMVSRAGRVGQGREVTSQLLKPVPAAGRSGRLSTGKGGVRARQSTPHPALVAARSQWESRWRPLIGRAASGNRGRARGDLGK